MHGHGGSSPGRTARGSSLRLLVLSIAAGFCISFGGGWVMAAQTSSIGSAGDAPVGPAAPLTAGPTRDHHLPPLMRSGPLQGDQIHQIYLCAAQSPAAPPQDATHTDPSGRAWTCAPARDNG